MAEAPLGLADVTTSAVLQAIARDTYTHLGSPQPLHRSTVHEE
jgi:hypothetical protein